MGRANGLISGNYMFKKGCFLGLQSRWFFFLMFAITSVIVISGMHGVKACFLRHAYTT